MKKQFLYYSLAIVFLFGIYATAKGVAAQMMTGAYGETSTTSKEIKRAAKFAVQQRTLRTGNRVTLIKVVKAEQQVVAGMNYRLVLRVADRRGRRRTATAVVFQSLKNQLSLTSWKAGESRE